jgi:DNA-binding NtrC family response regulator
MAREAEPGSPSKSPLRTTSNSEITLTQAAMGQPETKIGELCIELGVSRQTLYRHMNPKGELRPDGEKLLGRKKKGPPSAGRAQPPA